MNGKTLLAALACALLALSMLGCGTSNNLQSIQLSTSNTAESSPGTLDLQGEGGTVQLYAWGNYSSGKSLLLNDRNVTFQIAVTPGSTDENGAALATPPATALLSPNGLVTAVTPFVCSWVNEAVPPATSPAWALSGSYTVTVTYQGLTSAPAYVAVASAAGIANTTNPTGACGPTS